MSFKAMAWATEQEITETSPQSHLLLVMASYANEQNECYPSINTLVKKTRLSDKTVRKCLKDLLEMGLIFDTQKVSNFGAKVYLLNVENESDTPSNFTTPRNFTGGSKSSSTPLVDLPPNPIINHKNNHKDNLKYEHTHENPKNSQTEQSEKPTRKTSSVKTKKSTGGLTADDLMNLKLSDFNFTEENFKECPNLGDWIFENMDYQIAKDYLAMRTKKLTMTAIKSSVKEASKAGLNLSQALEVCIISGKEGWQTFKADWYFNAQKPPVWQRQHQTNGSNFFDDLARMHEQELQARNQFATTFDGEYAEIY